MSFGLLRGSTVATLGNLSIQPSSPAATGYTSLSLSPSDKIDVSAAASKVAVASTFSAIATNKKANIQFTRFNLGIVKDIPYFWKIPRFNDFLPTSTVKFTPYEELSGISSSRPEIISISEFKPLYSDNNASITPSGEFLDAQVKLMNIRQQAIISLINDMKKNEQVAEQLNQQEGNFLLHVGNLKNRVAFLQNVQGSIERTAKLFDVRDPSLKVDVKALLSQYYRQVFDDVNVASADYPLYGYSDLLVSHGFSRNRVLGFSGTKIYLQILNESKKLLRAGSDELLGIDPSLVGNDSDPAGMNRRTFNDPHVGLGKTSFPSLKNIFESNIHVSDNNLVIAINAIANGFTNLDNTFSDSTPDEISYAKKIRTITREYNYSKALSDTTTVNLLKQYGHTVSDIVGNQSLFDTVYGQIGNRITDDRSGINQSTLSSISSKIVNNLSILTFEADYLQNDDGSAFTPGASYYINSVVKPSLTGFSLQNTAELLTRMNGVVDKYVDFLGKFNILPKKGNNLNAQDASSVIASDPIVMLNSLYEIYVEPSTGLAKSDVTNTSVVNFLGAAATDARLRANLLLYVYCVTNLSGDGLPDLESIRERAGPINRAQDFSGVVVAEHLYTKVSATLDKVIKNCILRYKQLTNDDKGAVSIENSLKNFNEKALLSRILLFIVQFISAFSRNNAALTTDGITRYSTSNNTCMIALALQLVLDSTRRYAYVRSEQNLALDINANYTKNSNATNTQASTMRQTVTLKTSDQVANTKGFNPINSIVTYPSLDFNRFVSQESFKQAVETRLNYEDEISIKTALAPLNIVKVCRDALEQFILYLQSSSSVSTLNQIMRVVGDQKLVELLGERGQVQILTDAMDDILSRVDPSSTSNASKTDIVDVTSISYATGNADDLKMFDDSFITSPTVNMLKSVLSNNVFNTQRGSNIRLISVGLPHAFSTKLRNNFKISTFAEQVVNKPKQSDVVVFDIYKMDVRYPDLVFKPISKVFELSRFAVRNEAMFKQVQTGVELNTALDAVPTKDYSSIANPVITYGVQQVINDISYDFMTKQDCSNMVRNHVMSYVIELYFRLMTGIPLSERELYISDPDDTDVPTPFITRAMINHAVEKVFEVPFDSENYKMDLSKYTSQLDVDVVNFSKLSPNTGDTTSRSFTRTGGGKKKTKVVGRKFYSDVLGRAGAAADAGKKHTVYSDAEQTAKLFLSPKLFERIFWLAIDPDDYEIDYEETFMSPVGKSTFSKLQQAGEIEMQSTAVGQSNQDIYKMRELKATQQELVFEKYFITVRAYSSLSEFNSRKS